jgi:hypothetical protein
MVTHIESAGHLHGLHYVRASLAGLETIAVEWLLVIVSEFPAGILLAAIAWRFGHSLLWFGVFGTFW